MGEWDNRRFVETHVAGRGALGRFFAAQLKGTLKAGDSPSVAYLLNNARDDPAQPGWGGRFVRTWDGRKTTFDRLTTAADVVEVFGVVVFKVPAPTDMPEGHSARMIFDGRIPAVARKERGLLQFRFSPRDPKDWSYVVHSEYAGLDGLTGQFTAVPPSPEKARQSSSVHPHWWTDDPDPAAAEGVHAGAKHVSRWREAFLRNFAARMQRCQTPRQGGQR